MLPLLHPAVTRAELTIVTVGPIRMDRRMSWQTCPRRREDRSPQPSPILATMDFPGAEVSLLTRYCFGMESPELE